jgi:hypothetical protein
MSTARPLVSRSLAALLGVVALTAGMLVGNLACHRCECPPVFDPVPGTYQVVESPDRPELLGTFVEIDASTLAISYTDAEGDEWLVQYKLDI